MTAIDKRFAGADITDVWEITNGEGTNYRVRLAAKNKKYSFKVSAHGHIREVEKLPR